MNIVPIVAVAAAAVVAVVVLKKKKGGNAPEKKNFELPELSRKGILFAADNEAFEEYIKGKRYIKLVLPEETEEGDPVLSAIKSEEPDLMILSVKDAESLDQLKKILECDEEDISLPSVAVLADTKELNIIDALAKLKEDEKIVSFLSSEESFDKVLASFVLPLYKPEFTLDDGLESVAKIADKLGIPFVSSAAKVIQTGKDIKEAVEKEPGISNGAELLSIISDVMGWDKAASAADAVLKAADIKDLAEEEISRHEE